MQEIKLERAKETRAKKCLKKVSTADLVEEVAARQRAAAAAALAAQAKVVVPHSFVMRRPPTAFASRSCGGCPGNRCGLKVAVAPM